MDSQGKNAAEKANSDCTSGNSSIELKVQVGPNGKLPTRATEHSAGLDLYSAHHCVILPWDSKRIDTDIKLSLPANHCALIKGRSGLAFKKAI